VVYIKCGTVREIPEVLKKPVVTWQIRFKEHQFEVAQSSPECNCSMTKYLETLSM